MEIHDYAVHISYGEKKLGSVKSGFTAPSL